LPGALSWGTLIFFLLACQNSLSLFSFKVCLQKDAKI
jgi:hypothetical protein